MRALIARRRTVYVALVALLLICLAPAALVTNRVSNGGYLSGNAQSGRVLKVLEGRFHSGPPNVVVLVEARQGDVDAPAVVARGEKLTAAVAAIPKVVGVESYWTAGRPSVLRSADGRGALILAHADGEDDARQKTAALISQKVADVDRVDRVRVTGQAELQHEVNVEAKLDLVRAELIAGPLVLLLLLLVMRSVVAVLLTGALSVGVLVFSSAFIYLLTLLSPHVSVFALNLASTLGLGLSIDYGLFIISRFREELDNGRSSEEAALRTARTAGRAVMFSACTVALTQSVLLVFPVPVMRSFAYGGIPAALLAGALANLILIPGLAKLGPRIDRMSVRRKLQGQMGPQVWYRLARWVMARPIPVICVIVVVLVVLASPFRHLKLGNVDQSTLPQSNSARSALAAIQARFPGNEVATFPVVALGASPSRMAAIAARISELSTVRRVEAAGGSWSHGRLLTGPSPQSKRFAGPAGGWAAVVPSVGWVSPEAIALVRRLRGYDNAHLLVGGIAAETIDSNGAVTAHLPLALALIAVTMFLLLVAMFRSILVAVKAIAVNFLSLSASMGAVVWVFQEGHLSSLIGYTATGSTWVVAPVLIFCVAFGLSMDYEVFIISRIREEVDAGLDNEEAIARGLMRSAWIVTSASILISVVFLGLLSAHVGVMKILGLGLALAVLLDATLVRGGLVPAIMKLAGRANWWFPGARRAVSPTSPAASTAYETAAVASLPSEGDGDG